jgi:lysozyme
MDISQAGIDLLKHFEGFESQPYNDVAGNSTVGYGTLLHKGPVDLVMNPKDRLYAKGITPQDAEELLKEHLAHAVVPYLYALVKVPLIQCQFDALCCFIYNVGEGNFRSSTLLRKLNAGRYEDVPKEMMKWVFAGGVPSNGLRIRRAQEGQLWSSQAG